MLRRLFFPFMKLINILMLGSIVLATIKVFPFYELVNDVYVEYFMMEEILKSVSVDYRGLNFETIRNLQIIVDGRMNPELLTDIAATFLPNKLKDVSISVLLSSSLNALISLRGNEKLVPPSSMFIDRKSLRNGMVLFGENSQETSLTLVDCGNVSLASNFRFQTALLWLLLIHIIT